MNTALATKVDLQLLRKDLALMESRVVIKLGVLMTSLFGIAAAAFALLLALLVIRPAGLATK